MKAETSEHPIIFSGAMVRAILAGRKSQTRRVIKPQPSNEWSPVVGFYCPTLIDRRGEECPGEEIFGAADESEGRKCPYGAPGHRLWVREAWHGDAVFDADPPDSCVGSEIAFAADGLSNWLGCGKLRPSIHMPRWASRLTLEVMEVRVRRVQEISAQDAIAEGIERLDPRTSGATVIGRFMTLWDSINAKRGYGWEANPWVWALSFNMVDR